MVISLTGLLFDQTTTSKENPLLQTHLNETIIALNPTSMFQSISLTFTSYWLVRNITNIDHPSFIAEPSSVSEFSSVENANQYCDFLCTAMDKHAPPYLQKVITHNS